MNLRQLPDGYKPACAPWDADFRAWVNLDAVVFVAERTDGLYADPMLTHTLYLANGLEMGITAEQAAALGIPTAKAAR